MKQFIWLFGENLGNTANNNSYYLWRHIVEKEDGIDKYFVISKTPENKKFYTELSPQLQKYIVWRNSLKHFYLYLTADMYFVTLSYRDVRPEQLLKKEYNFLTIRPVIYLQHGTLAMKKLGYNGRDYNNNMFRFVYYNAQIKDALIDINGFKEYQLYNGEFHPRYQELIAKNDNYIGQRNKILWFITWREYLGNNVASKILYLTFEHILSDPRLEAFLDEHDYMLEVCFHDQFNVSHINQVFDNVHSERISWCHAKNINVMDELVACNLLITDYSSVGFDVTVLNKPVLLFMPDLEEYKKKREFYCDMDELKEYTITSCKKLIDTIVSGDWKINPFFRSRIPEVIDYEYIRTGGHMDRMYEYFAGIQRRKISFLGYNFYGIGGTVQATRAMAEALLEKGYLVELISLKQNRKPENVPYALNMQALYDVKRNGISDKLKKKMVRNPKHYGSLAFDKDRDNLIPYAGYALKKWLSNCNSETVISTRESLHPFLHMHTSKDVKNKLYYFHCSPLVFDDIFPGLAEELKQYKLGKAVFVTENNRAAYFEKYSYTPYEQYLILGNPLDSSRMIKREEIQPVEEKEVYRGMYLVRLSSDRKPDIENLLNYGRYLKEHACKDIVIDVFGAGDYVQDFLRTVISEELNDYIRYRGQTNSPKFEFAQHDAVVDFSMAHSFGMPYIEGVLNGKMVFCMRNVGSEEVMAEIPDAYINSFDDLTEKIRNLPQMTVEDLARNYDAIAAKYSRSVVSDELVRYIEK